ncbi:hypothetical protein HMPREF9552_00044, partial [Escherichia coli MS 198-1]
SRELPGIKLSRRPSVRMAFLRWSRRRPDATLARLTRPTKSCGECKYPHYPPT